MTESDIVSIRIDNEVKDLLINEAKDKGISFNKLIRQILTRHVKWFTMAEKMDMISIPKAAYKKYTSYITDGEIKQIGLTVGKESFKNYTLLSSGEFKIKPFIETLQLWLTINKLPFEYIVNSKDSNEFVIRHDLGKKFSILLTAIVSSLVEELDHKFTMINNTDNNLTFIINTGV